MSQPPAKRQRTEEDKDAPITRSELWHTDGSVVLQAENTQFRVHWSVLARNSSFFRDMQSLPQPPSQPTVEGCPVVELPDAEIDVEFVLKALYTPTLLAEPTLPLSAVGALVRLGRKYDFEELFNSAVGRLAFENPTSFEEYEARIVDHQYAPTRITPSPGFSFDMVTLLSENRLWSLLPCACFRLVVWGKPAKLFDGISRQNGTLASLSFVDLRRCVAGREFLLTKQLEPGYTFGWSRGWNYNKCTNPDQCASMRTVIVEACSDYPALANSMDDFSGIWGSLSMLAGLKKVWEELPRAFGLPAWDELKNDP
ncbi:hypothetical protein B0H16DRAFT_1493965 [Mycena metata]|uniref:BTB domain-containing protein n=1 Tax=Mycena metata TaxID=1033252 RepID=A0AAD7KGC2_9AGAR|nr:hypothetical protein B0H16DRAFT_1493965 [Mycena metata]